jgi:hypothetical protein
VRNGLAKGRQPDATRQDDRLGKAAIPGHDATPERNRDSSACSRVIPTCAFRGIAQAGYLPWTIHPIVSVLRVCRDMAILLRLKRSFNSSDVAYGALPIEPLHPRIDSLTGSVHLARNLWGGLPGL